MTTTSLKTIPSDLAMRIIRDVAEAHPGIVWRHEEEKATDAQPLGKFGLVEPPAEIEITDPQQDWTPAFRRAAAGAFTLKSLLRNLLKFAITKGMTEIVLSGPITVEMGEEDVYVLLHYRLAGGAA